MRIQPSVLNPKRNEADHPVARVALPGPADWHGRSVGATMKRQPESVTRETILRILSDEEAASVGSETTSTQIEDGDEFIDLGEIEKGVQRSVGSHRQKNLLLRKAIHENTWRKVTTDLAARQLAGQPPAPPPPRNP
jgi:hypothetical protein